MSRVAKNPIVLPDGVEVNLTERQISVKGKKGSIEREIPVLVKIAQTEKQLTFAPANDEQQADAAAGTMRAVVNNMVEGVAKGFESKLVLVGVGYKAQAQGKKLNLALGHSHPINFEIPEGITIETPSQTEVTIKGIDKEVVGQVAAEIRALRPPEPYKGKGVRYLNEVIVLKEAKKK